MNTEDLYRFGVAGFVFLLPFAGLLGRDVVALVAVAIVVGFVIAQIHHAVYDGRTFRSRRFRGALDLICERTGISEGAAFQRWEIWSNMASERGEATPRLRRLLLFYHSFMTIFLSASLALVVMVAISPAVLAAELELEAWWFIAPLYLLLAAFFLVRGRTAWRRYSDYEAHVAAHAGSTLWAEPLTGYCIWCGLPEGPLSRA